MVAAWSVHNKIIETELEKTWEKHYIWNATPESAEI